MKKFPIDLSCLTEEEISQFQEDPYTLYNGDQDVALYLRYSSTGQSDQSIEGQLRDCRTFCKANHYRIVAIYVDRATTARKDVEKRVHLMEMVADSAKQNWEYVIVWKLDRFARNRNDSAIMKMRLRKNGVKVLSATEHLTDSPESIILESVLEGMAEFFSAELSQKVTRGMRESALKCHSVGGHIPLGYKVENHKLVVDPDTAHIVQEAFSLYANGESVAAICRKFNSAGYKTAKIRSSTVAALRPCSVTLVTSALIPTRILSSKMVFQPSLTRSCLKRYSGGFLRPPQPQQGARLR